MSSENVYVVERIKMEIGFVGDLAFCGYLEDASSLLTIDAKIEECLQLSDHNVVNLEGPCTVAPILKKNGLSQKADEKCASFLKNHGLSMCFLANNHMMDCGYQGLRDTITFCKNYDIMYFGAGTEFSEAIRPVIIEKDGVKVGLIGVGHKDGIIASPQDNSGGIMCDCWNYELCEAIRELRTTVDYCVVTYHGGYEFYGHACINDRNKYIGFLEYGADVVVAHHPHVVRGYENLDGRYIFYSLGNFLFDTPYQRRNRNTENGVVLRLIFSKENGISFETCFTIFDRNAKKLYSVPSNNDFSPVDPKTMQSLFEQDVYNSVVDERKTKKHGLLKQCVKAVIRSNEREKYMTALRHSLKRVSNEI